MAGRIERMVLALDHHLLFLEGVVARLASCGTAIVDPGVRPAFHGDARGAVFVNRTGALPPMTIESQGVNNLDRGVQ